MRNRRLSALRRAFFLIAEAGLMFLEKGENGEI